MVSSVLRTLSSRPLSIPVQNRGFAVIAREGACRLRKISSHITFSFFLKKEVQTFLDTNKFHRWADFDTLNITSQWIFFSSGGCSEVLNAPVTKRYDQDITPGNLQLSICSAAITYYYQEQNRFFLHGLCKVSNHPLPRYIPRFFKTLRPQALRRRESILRADGSCVYVTTPL